MDLTIELNKLTDYMNKCDTTGFNAYLKDLYDKSNSDEKDTITQFIERHLEKSTAHVKDVVSEVQTRMQLDNIIEVLPLAYISKRYFNRTRQWLYQRINGNIVNGKLARFTESEVRTFNNALQDISQRIGSAAIYS